MKVKNHMSPQPVTVTPAATVDEALNLMHNHRLTGLPVLEDGRVVGIITLTDVLGVLVEILGLLSETVRLDVALPPEPGLLDMVHNIISRHGGKVISLALVSAEDERRVYSFRLEKIDLAEIVRELTAAGFAVTE